MEWRNVGTEALKYAVTGFAGFGLGAVFGKATGNPPFSTGGVFAVSFVGSRVLNSFVRKQSLKYDLNLSTYHIVKKIADTLLKLVTAVSLFSIGVLSTTGFMVMGGVALTFCAIEIGLGVYLKYTEQDELLDNITVDTKTSWLISRAFA